MINPSLILNFLFSYFSKYILIIIKIFLEKILIFLLLKVSDRNNNPSLIFKKINFNIYLNNKKLKINFSNAFGECVADLAMEYKIRR